MEGCPTEIHILVCQSLSSGDIAKLSHASRLYCDIFEPILYHLHAFAPEQSAVAWAVDCTLPDQPVTRKRALAILDKVKRFSLIKPGALDVAYGSLNLHPDQYWQPGFGSYVSLYAASQSLREQKLPFQHSSSGTGSRSWEMVVPPLKDAFLGVWTPLHLAAWKGLDETVEWLVSNGASVDVSMIKGALITPVLVAVIVNNISTAALLLANGASPNIGPDNPVHDAENREGGEKSHKPLTVFHLACAMGSTYMVQQLLAAGQIKSNPTDLLMCYGALGTEEAPALVECLGRPPAKIPNRVFHILFDNFKWWSALELLRSIHSHDRLGMSRRRASQLIRDLLSSSDIKRDLDAAECLSQQLLDLGGDPHLGKLLWARSDKLGSEIMLQLLRPFVGAGMDFDGSLWEENPQRHQGDRPGDHLQRQFDELNIQDFLGQVTAYPRENDSWKSKLALVRLMLLHHAYIHEQTMRDALIPLGGVLLGRYDERGKWAFRLCNTLLDHCRETDPSLRGLGGQKEFLRRVSCLRTICRLPA